MDRARDRPVSAPVCRCVRPYGAGGSPSPHRGNTPELGRCTTAVHYRQFARSSHFRPPVWRSKMVRDKTGGRLRPPAAHIAPQCGPVSNLPGGRIFRPCVMLGGRKDEKYPQNPAVPPFPKVAVKGVYEKLWRSCGCRNDESQSGNRETALGRLHRECKTNRRCRHLRCSGEIPKGRMMRAVLFQQCCRNGIVALVENAQTLN